MKINVKLSFIIFVLLSHSFLLCKIDNLEKAYDNGDIEIVRQILDTLTVESDENVAARMFFSAKLKSNKDEINMLLESLTSYFPETYYGQLGYLEQSQIHFLNRSYNNSIYNLKQITNPGISDKHYWLAKSYFHIGEYLKAINSAQTFINTSQDTTKIEVSYISIAESYIKMNDFEKALEILQKLQNSKNLKNQKPLVLFKIGVCHEKLGHLKDSIAAFKELMILYPYHQYTFKAEEILYALKNDHKDEISTSSLSSVGEVKKDNEIEEKKEGKEIKTHNIKENDVKDNFDTTQYYLQAGAFSSDSNAKKHVDTINEIGYSSIIFSKIINGKQLHIVAVGPFASKTILKDAQKKLKDNKINSFMIRRK